MIPDTGPKVRDNEAYKKLSFFLVSFFLKQKIITETCDSVSVLVTVWNFRTANGELCFVALKTNTEILGRNFCHDIDHTEFICMPFHPKLSMEVRAGLLFSASLQANAWHNVSIPLPETLITFLNFILFSSFYIQCFYFQVVALKILTKS